MYLIQDLDSIKICNFKQKCLFDAEYLTEQKHKCKVAGFNRGVVEAFALLGCYVASVDIWLALDNWTDMLCRNFGDQLSTYAV
jgi:hypothetical protein